MRENPVLIPVSARTSAELTCMMLMQVYAQHSAAAATMYWKMGMYMPSADKRRDVFQLERKDFKPANNFYGITHDSTADPSSISQK